LSAVRVTRLADRLVASGDLGGDPAWLPAPLQRFSSARFWQQASSRRVKPRIVLSALFSLVQMAAQRLARPAAAICVVSAG
jgi:hypothetical protein